MPNRPEDVAPGYGSDHLLDLFIDISVGLIFGMLFESYRF
jgi:hypothetical protein